jgi:DNA-directed RNA polymerase subunit RPC12/RpoP
MPVGTSQKVQDRIIANLTKNGAELISFEKGRKVRYRCSCGNETESYTSNVNKPTWGGCATCSNQRRGNKNDYEFARKVWEKGGEVLPKQEYKGNKVKMHYTCSNCGEEAHISLNEFRRGRRCENCAKSRAKETNLERYGVENVFQSEEIKQRIKDSNMEKYGVDHHMKVPEILQKAIDTNIDKYGLAFAFHSEESFDKIHATCMERYGVEYPLQNEYIQEKVIESCRESLGVDYPFQSEEIQKQIEQTFQDRYGMGKYEYLQMLYQDHKEEYRQKADETCMERYGMTLHEYLALPEHREKADKTCMERYGMTLHEYLALPEHREKARLTCLERYGVEYPAQCEEIFHKMMVSGYQRKEYTFPSGRVEYCQGYEPLCLEHLLETYDEDDIVVGYKGREAIWYPNPDKDGKLSRYFPDGFIKSENAIIEVKSEYYYKKDIAKNHAKFKAVTGMGMKVFLYVFDKKDFLYTKIYTKDRTVVCPYQPANIVIVDDSDDEE